MMHASRSMTTPSVTELIVEQGPQQGARLTLSPGRYVAGSALSDDIVLLDPSLLPGHFVIDIGEEVVVQAADGSLELDGPAGRRLAIGETISCTRALRFTAGETIFRLTVPRSSSRGRDWARINRVIATGAAALGVAAAVFFFASPTGNAAMQPVVGKLHMPLQAALPAPGLAGAVVPDMAAAMQASLGAARLDMVNASRGVDGVLTLSGTVTPAQQAALRDIERGFDNRFGAQALLVDDVQVANEAPLLAVRAAWTGTDPYVIDGDGDRLLVGARLPSGWTIAGITADTVLLHRGSRSLALRY